MHYLIWVLILFQVQFNELTFLTIDYHKMFSFPSVQNYIVLSFQYHCCIIILYVGKMILPWFIFDHFIFYHFISLFSLTFTFDSIEMIFSIILRSLDEIINCFIYFSSFIFITFFPSYIQNVYLTIKLQMTQKFHHLKFIAVPVYVCTKSYSVCKVKRFAYF